MRSLQINIDCFKKMNFLISNHRTGTPNEFASKLCVTERTFHVYIKKMRGFVKPLGLFIVYDRELETYKYSKPVSVEILIKDFAIEVN